MRTLLLVLFTSFFLTNVYAQDHMPPSDNPLKGVWRMVFQRSVFDTHVDTTLVLGEHFPGGDQVKILTDTHFAFGRQSDDGENVTAGGGRYRIEGTTYIEMIEYHTSGPLVGTEIPFSWKIQDGMWYHQGDFSNFRLEEVWVRVDGNH